MRFFLSANALLLFALSAAAQDAAKLNLKGSGWFQFGRVMHSSDTLDPVYNYNGNWIQNSGAQFTVIADIDENWQGAMGLGGMQFHNAQGKNANSTQTVLGFTPYITQARFTYSLGPDRKTSPLVASFGLFPYQYNPDVRNLGAYLLRGPVYPGIVFSEFESKSIDTTVGNILGLQVRNNIGDIFTHDLILRSETDLPPLFDFSLAYIATLKLGGVLELGSGVNFYHALPIQPGMTNLTDKNAFKLVTGPTPYSNNYAYINGADTVLLSHKGIKVMGRFAFDPKPWLGSDALGPRDLRLYAEAAVIGTKSYPGIYPNIKERIPVMVGFNLPTFKVLDEAALEVEWYGAPFRDDYRRLYIDKSPVPISNGYINRTVIDSSDGHKYISFNGATYPYQDPYNVEDMRKDNWKWSFYASKSFRNCVKVSFQAANDHFRSNAPLNSDLPAGTVANATSGRFDSDFTTLKDWYMMLKLGFFF